MKKYKIYTPEPSHWQNISRLIGLSIPNAIIFHLGNRFASIYYQNIFQNTNSCCFVALGDRDKVVGVIIGTVNCSEAKTMSPKKKIKLLMSANTRLLSPFFLKWFLKGIVYKLINRNENLLNLPNSELVVITVDSDFRGTRLAYDLTEKMEDFMKENGNREPYMILTEKDNLRANRFYSKIGAEFVESYYHHGREMNYWKKDIF